MPAPARPRLFRAAVAATMALLLALALWRTFGARPLGRFPILRDVPIVHLPVGPAVGKVRPVLRAAANEARKQRPRAHLRFLVDLAAQLDFDEFAPVLRDRGADKARWREAVLRALDLVAEAHQADLMQTLEAMRAAGRVERFDAMRIVNRIAVVAGDPGVVDELSQRPDVYALVEDAVPHRPSADGTPGAVGLQAEPERPTLLRRPVPKVPANPVSWAIDAIHAPAAWKRGLVGRGVVVGILDSGVRRDHDQLRDNWRGAVEPARAAESWYHPVDPQAKEPVDSSWHGTTVLSAAVGLNRPLRDGRRCVIGVAPGAIWVAAVAFYEEAYDHLLFTSAADWMLFRARPDVVIHAATYDPEAADPMAARIFDAFKSAQTVVVMAAGNTGPEPGRNNAPAHFPSLSLFGVPAFSVGSTRPDGKVSEFSARGPSALDPVKPFPQVVAPGEDVTVAFSSQPDAIIRDLGTSLAAGYVAGAAAILLQARPEMTANEVEYMLKRSARPVGELPPNNEAGWGQVDLAKAVELLDLAKEDEDRMRERLEKQPGR